MRRLLQSLEALRTALGQNLTDLEKCQGQKLNLVCSFGVELNFFSHYKQENTTFFFFAHIHCDPSLRLSFDGVNRKSLTDRSDYTRTPQGIKQDSVPNIQRLRLNSREIKRRDVSVSSSASYKLYQTTKF